MGDNDNYLDLRGLVSGREERPKLEHSVDWSYGERRKGERRQVARRQGEESGAPVHHIEPVTRRSFLKYGSVAAAVAAVAAAGINLRGSDQPLSHAHMVAAALQKEINDYELRVKKPLTSESKLPQIAHPDGRQVMTDTNNAWAYFYPDHIVTWFERTGRAEFRNAIPLMLAKLHVGSFGDDPVYEEYNNPAMARRRVAQRAKQALITSGQFSSLDAKEQDTVLEVAREARASEMMVARMADKEIGALYGLAPQKQNRVLTTDHEFFLYPLLLDGLRHSIQGVLDPKSEIKRPQNALEEILVQLPAMRKDELYEIVIKGTLLYNNALTTPDGRSVQKAKVSGNLAFYDRNPRHPNDSGYDTNDPATVTPDHIQKIAAGLTEVELLKFLREYTSPSEGYRGRMLDAERFILDRCQAMAELVEKNMCIEFNMAGILDAGFSPKLIGNLNRRRLNQGILPGHLYLPGNKPTCYEELDVGSTAMMVEPFYALGRVRAAEMARDKVLGIMSETLKERENTIGTLPPFSRGWYPSWTHVWTVTGQHAATQLLLR